METMFDWGTFPSLVATWTHLCFWYLALIWAHWIIFIKNNDRVRNHRLIIHNPLIWKNNDLKLRHMNYKTLPRGIFMLEKPSRLSLNLKIIFYSRKKNRKLKRIIEIFKNIFFLSSNFFLKYCFIFKIINLHLFPFFVYLFLISVQASLLYVFYVSFLINWSTIQSSSIKPRDVIS